MHKLVYVCAAARSKTASKWGLTLARRRAGVRAALALAARDAAKLRDRRRTSLAYVPAKVGGRGAVEYVSSDEVHRARTGAKLVRPAAGWALSIVRL